MTFFTFWFAFAAMLMALQSIHTSRNNREYFKRLGEAEAERDEIRHVLAAVLDGEGNVVGQLALPAPPEQKALPPAPSPAPARRRRRHGEPRHKCSLPHPGTLVHYSVGIPPQKPRSLPVVVDRPATLAGIPIPSSMANCAGCLNRSSAKYRVGSVPQYRCKGTGGGVRRALLRQWQHEDEACSGWTPLNENDDD